MLTPVTNNTQILEAPTLKENTKKPLPIPVSPAELRKKLIEDIAEELHPGNWCLGDSEPKLYTLFNEQARLKNNLRCTCDSCVDWNYELCTNNHNKEDHKRLIIRIPEANIRNSRNEEHLIKDFYIAIGFLADYSAVSTTMMFSMRSTVTTKEYSRGAFHPHSHHVQEHDSLDNYFTWRRMCLGGDTELTDIMFTLLTDGVSKAPLFELMLLLHIYAGWESLEGGPYRSIRTYKYPREDSSSSLNLNRDLLYSNFLNVLATTDDIPRPELIGSGRSLAVANAMSSIVPAIKAAMLDVMKIEDPESTKRNQAILSNLGVKTDDGSFVPLFDNNMSNSTLWSRKQYEKRVHLTEVWSKSNSDKVLKFRGNTTNFTMTLDEDGLDGTAPKPTLQQIENCTVHPYLVGRITNEYLIKLKSFTIKQKF
jgi:hypothetical protein